MNFLPLAIVAFMLISTLRAGAEPDAIEKALRGDDDQERARAAWDLMDKWPRTAVRILRLLGDEDARIRKLFITGLRTYPESSTADFVLEACGEEVGRALTNLLQKDDVEAAVAGMDALEGRNYAETEYGPALMAKALAEDKDPAVRRRAARVLNLTRGRVLVAIPALKKALAGDPDAGVREAAAGVLGRIAAKDEDAAAALKPFLEKAAADPAPGVAWAAGVAARRADPAKREALEEELSELLTHANLLFLQGDPERACAALETLVNDAWETRAAHNARALLNIYIEDLAKGKAAGGK